MVDGCWLSFGCSMVLEYTLAFTNSKYGAVGDVEGAEYHGEKKQLDDGNQAAASKQQHQTDVSLGL